MGMPCGKLQQFEAVRLVDWLNVARSDVRRFGSVDVEHRSGDRTALLVMDDQNFPPYITLRAYLGGCVLGSACRKGRL